MGAKFCFFTDPALLGTQSPDQAFGPVDATSPSAVAGKDRFRVTDLHMSTGAAPAIAACDGLVCAQADDSGTLSLILKPIHQPPFDFPLIDYLLYKGVDPASLLDNGQIDVGKRSSNDLIEAIARTWESDASGNATGSVPGRGCLGLHLDPADYPVVADRPRFADDQPLDNLFYSGDPDIQFALVRAGDRLGFFDSAGAFGIEIVAERIDRRPPIALARKVENVVEVTSLDIATLHDFGDVDYFMHWHDKEEILSFLDPCAFWGSFFHARLRVPQPNGSTQVKKGAEIYEAVLRGSFDDATPSAGVFFNRNRVYLDIRNEHGRSFNYYKTNGDLILLSLDPAAAIEASERSYNSGGWPLFAFDQALLPPSISDPFATLRLAFRTNDHAQFFLHACPKDLAKARGASARRFTEHDISAAPTTPENRFQLPLHGSAPSRTIARYLGLTLCFRGMRDPGPGEGPQLRMPWEPPEGIPFEPADIPFHRSGGVSVKTFGTNYLLNLPFVSPRRSVYNIGWVSDGAQSALMLNPDDEIAREVGAPAGAYSLHLRNANLLDAVSQVVRPLTAVVQQTGTGESYVACVAASQDDRIAQANSKRAILFLSQQTLSDIALAAGSDAAAVTLAPAMTWRDDRRVVLRLEGLRPTNGGMERFSTIVDAGTVANVDTL